MEQLQIGSMRMMMARLTEATESDLGPSAGMRVYDSGKRSV